MTTVTVPPTVAYLLELLVGFPARQRSRYRTHRRRIAADSVLRSADVYFAKIESLESTAGRQLIHTRTLHNVALYVLLLNRDLVELAGDMCAAIGDFRRKFVARQTAVLLVEAADAIPALIGGDYRTSLRIFGLLESLAPELNAISRGFSSFRSTHRPLLGTIRNNIAAHRDKDALKQAQAMATINPLQVLTLAAEFSAPLNALVAFQARVISHAGTISGLLRDISQRRAPDDSALVGRPPNHHS